MWDFNFQRDPGSAEPLFLQIARALTCDIRRGRLRPGDRLPGTRTLARIAGVNRVTVLAAYDELAAEGWVRTHPARGTFVAADVPQTPVRRSVPLPAVEATAGWTTAAYELPRGPQVVKWLPPAPGVLTFRSSHPDTRLFRAEPFLRACRTVLRRSQNRLLGYGDPEGHPRLRRAIAAMLRETRALSLSAENILVTRGSQMALAIAARAVARAGAVIAVEEPGYRHAWSAFTHAGATLAPIPVDAQGLDVEFLTRLVARRHLAAVYVTPHHQLPTTVPLDSARRRQLLQLARAHGFVVIEDDYDHEFHYDGAPLAPLASIDPGVVLYIGTFSKILAPGLRVGYLAAPANVVEQLSAYRQSLDLQGDPVIEAALAELIDDEEVQRQVRRVRRIYRARRDTLVNTLERHLSHVVGFSIPDGGLGLWLSVAPDVDVDEWAATAQQHGVAFLTGREFTIDRSQAPFIRLGFGSLNEQELAEAVARMAAAVPSRSSTRVAR